MSERDLTSADFDAYFSGSHAPAWEQVRTLQRHETLAAGAAQLRSHAGAWERARLKYGLRHPLTLHRLPQRGNSHE